MLTEYKPKKFAKEYVEINRSNQYPMFAATALGAKPCYDDWVDVSKYYKFVDMAEKYGLKVLPNMLFAPPPDKKDVIGSKNITTTYFTGQPFREPLPKRGSVHLIVSKDEKILLEARKFSWYPIIINKSFVSKPFVDHLRFGKLLGFPDCCVKHFCNYNNWHLFSHQYETLKNTPKTDGAIGSYYCNNMLMDRTFFLIHNIPCSYRCEKTIKLAKNVEKKISEVEPDFVKHTRTLLKRPMLVFGEKHFIIFNGEKQGNSITYSDCEYISNDGRPEEKIDFFDDIKKTDKIILKDKLIAGNKTIKRKDEWFLIDFD